jgi:bifunctional DNase/RNase
MIEVIVESVRVSLTNQHRIVVLREKDGDRHLPIWIGAFEAESITLALQEIEVARPQTHDLLKNTIQALNGRLVRIEIVSLKDDVFYGNLIIAVDVNDQFIFVDCRPSDAIALAIRCRVPIIMSSEIMEVAGFVPEQEIDANAVEESTEMIPDEQPEENVDRLSVFEDFLESLDTKDTGDKSDEDTEPPSDDQPDLDKPQK